ncbi:MAG TPA: hypothetical protein PKZ53_04880, partial [Acidobacteriota bacterium]|nr:hypothetical protein [Acidobacteriota bacterium]
MTNLTLTRLTHNFSQAVRSGWRFGYVTLLLSPFLISFLRDQRRFVKWGAPRDLSLAAHHRRARWL